MDERVRFIAAWSEGDEPLAELCRGYGISRKTAYKWIERYEALGPRGLEDKPTSIAGPPRRHVADAVVDAILGARKEHPTWGPRKLRAWLVASDTQLVLPAASSIGEILKRHGLVRARKRRRRVPIHALSPIEAADKPNAVWCADFKGHFALGDGKRCYPLTITDANSRYLLKCEGMLETKDEPVRRHFELAFREFGMPLRMRTDNGPPFASVGLAGLTQLSVWWIKLGVTPERIEPGKPQQNGRHERMHRTLKAEATQPPGETLAAQQRMFDRFRHEYNDIRPHEALAQKPPARLYSSSARAFPREIGSPEYPDMVVRRADAHGRILSNVHLSPVLANEPVGLKEIGDKEWQVFYGPFLLGRLDRSASKTVFHPIRNAKKHEAVAV